MKLKSPSQFLLLLLLGQFAIPTSSASNTAITKPNVLFIAIDDLRPEIGCYGSKQIETPNLDRLAGNGTLFLNAYCNVAVCGASRASLMTSLRPIPNRRFTSYTSRADADASGIVTLPEHFKTFGYHTLSNGKVFHMREDSPQSWSEEAWRTYGSNGQEPQLYNKYDMWLDPGSARLVNNKRGPFYEAADVADNAYYDGRVCDKTIDDLKRLAKGNQPFFLACGFWRPHLPFNAPKKYWDLYDRKKIEIAANRHLPKDAPKGLRGSNELKNQYAANDGFPDDEEFHRLARHGYFACVSYIDAQVGKIMETLEELGLNDNTIVIVWGDHGFHLGEHNLWGKHNTMKHSVRAPLIIRQPGKEAQRLDQIVEFVDVYPTLCDLASLPIPTHCEGKSIKPIMTDPSAAHKEAVFTSFGSVYSVKTKNFLYSEWVAGPPARMLYDHRKDPEENVNVAESAEYTEEVNRHHEIFEDLRKTWNP
ncbi:sulfatase [Haloferula sp.]|uniref:sulfatase n=1 Tax=Haloferula sp. TaxID=2497595 RepID=UPI003C76C24E